MAEDAKSAREAMEKSRIEVMECEEEIKSIKASLKSIALGAGSADSSSNRLAVSVHKVKSSSSGGGDAPAAFKIHLSSPIEERTITKLNDPLDPAAEGSLAEFESVETSNALLTVEAYDADVSSKLGESAAHDLLPLCQDMELWKKGGDKKTSMLEVAIIAEEGSEGANVSEAAETDAPESNEAGEEDAKTSESESWEDAVEDVQEDNKGEKSAEKDDEEEQNEDTAEKDGAEDSTTDAVAQDETSATKLELPAYTLTLQLEYKPSLDDKRDALYDKLNEASKRKVAAIESLRKNAGIVNRAKAAEAPGPSKSGAGGKRPAVKPGFLNKPKASEAKAPPFWKRWYEKTIGPKSMLWVAGPIAKNYVIFVGMSLLIHYKGDLLALPPPV
ncbi:hypothetical protein ACHAWF_013034 [Thalassiosira exigua]